MNPTAPQPEGSNRASDIDANSEATGSSTELSTTHWAYGMPLSYVLEMAHHQLGVFDRTAEPAAPAAVPEGTQTGND